MNALHYKGFIGSIEASPEDNCLYGKLLYTTDLVTYEGKTVNQVKKAFKEAVDDYLLTCKQLNRAPIKPFKGSLNVRIGPDLHKEAAMHAATHGVTLNEYIKHAVQHQIEHEQRV